MTSTPPTTLPSQLNPHAETSEQLRVMQFELARLKALQARPVVVRREADEPDPRSTVRKAAESRWTPVGIAALLSALAPLLTTWIDSHRETEQTIEMSRKLDALGSRLEAAEKAQQEATRRLSERVDAIVATAQETQLSELKRRLYEDSVMCRLGVDPPDGRCPDVDFRRRRTPDGVRVRPSLDVPSLPSPPE